MYCGKILHTRNRHLRIHRRLSVAFSNGLRAAFSNIVSPFSGTVSFHNFKSQNFKLSVSNPKSKYVAYLSVLSQISIARV